MNKQIEKIKMPKPFELIELKLESEKAGLPKHIKCNISNNLSSLKSYMVANVKEAAKKGMGNLTLSRTVLLFSNVKNERLTVGNLRKVEKFTRKEMSDFLSEYRYSCEFYIQPSGTSSICLIMEIRLDWS